MNEYIVNSDLHEMELGEGEGTVFFNPTTENTHVLDDIAQDIIKLFKEKNTIEAVIDSLAEMYDADKAIIEADVREFVKTACQNNILLQVEK